MTVPVGIGAQLLYGHRGAAGLAPENTLAAFEHGHAAGADGFELDVQLSRDGVVMVHHDDTVDRTTDGTGRVAELTADALARLDAGYRFEVNGSAPFRGQGIGVPRFEDIVRRFPDAALIVELKNRHDALADAVVDVLRRAGACERAIVGCFYPEPLARIRRTAPEVATGASTNEVRWALYRSWLGLPPSQPAYRGFQVPEKSGVTRVVSRRFVRAANRAGVAVKVWTVNDLDDARRLLDWGVQGLISDRPDRLRQVMGRGT